MKRLLALTVIFIVGCKSPFNYLDAGLISKNGFYQAVIEIPAGTNSKIEYDKNSRIFKASIRDNEERIINFLPYPANYGFIPSTYSNPENGGDGDPLDVMVLSSTLQPGTILEIIPIALLKLLDNEEEDYKLIAVPANPELRTINAVNYKEFVKNYNEAKQIIEIWFSSYDKADPTEIKGWGNEKEAIQEIERLRVKL